MRVLIALVVLGLAGFGLIATGMVDLRDVRRIAGFTEPAPSIALPSVDLKSLRSQTGFLLGSFVIGNTNAFPVAKTAIHCDVLGPGEAAIQTFDFVIEELVPAHGQTTITDHKFGFWAQQSSRMRCRSTSVERR
jgi:hypothetical protein